MGYVTNGKPHYTGLLREKEIIKYLNSLTDQEILKKITRAVNMEITKVDFVHIGGTRNVIDTKCILNSLNASVKSKELKLNGIPKGTFDLINLGSIFKDEDLNTHELIKNINDLYKYKKEIRAKEPNEIDIEEVKHKLKNNFIKSTNSIDATILKKAFKEIKKRYETIDFTIIHYWKDKTEMPNKENIFIIKKGWVKDMLEKINLYQKISTKKQSYRLLNKDGTKSPLRVRSATNNGAKAFSGMNKYNKTKNQDSVFTLKFQIDDVMRIINDYQINDD